MSIGVSKSRCKFYINEKRRQVICVIPDTREDFIEYALRHFSWMYWADPMDAYRNELRMPNSFMGKAVCSDDDEWNEELGKTIAYSRAKAKYYKSFFKRGNRLIYLIDRAVGNAVETMNDFGAYLEDKHAELEKDIEERTQN